MSSLSPLPMLVTASKPHRNIMACLVLYRPIYIIRINASGETEVIFGSWSADLHYHEMSDVLDELKKNVSEPNGLFVGKAGFLIQLVLISRRRLMNEYMQ